MWLRVAFHAMHEGAYRTNTPTGEGLPGDPANPLNETGFRSDYGNALVALDLAIGRITDALKVHGMWEKTLLFVVSDNGGDNPGTPRNSREVSASNDPLVGRKCLS
jgi:arylsulfatase A-like enzyme